jgi:thiol-disulfide isomerase/thioredoxin
VNQRTATLLIAFASGIAVSAATIAMILWVTNDMRWVLCLGSVGLFCAALWLGSRRRGGGLGFVLLSLPLVLVHGALVLPGLPGLWPHLPLWLSFAALGWLGFRESGRSPKAAIAGIVLVAALASWYALARVPGAITQALARLRDDPAPEFALDHLDGTRYPVESLAGKVVVLDFFATWCAPCIAELPEIEAVHRRYAATPDTEVLVVANDSGDDTPELIRAFVSERDPAVPFVYDPGGGAHEAFGFAGLPGLVVIDRSGRLRLTREGYNAAETDFQANLVDLIETLRATRGP